MKKKTWLIVAITCILPVLAVAVVFVNSLKSQDKMSDILHRTGNALGDEWKKQTVTNVSDMVYSDDDGNTIVYHVCVTTFFEADPTKQRGLNTEAISSVIPTEEAENSREYTVCDLPAVIYQKEGRAYLCWTILPELSCVIEYDPAVEREEDILRMAESVPANQGKSSNP